MRLFAWSLMIVCAFTLGCEQPEETLPPSVTPETSGTSDDGHDHDHEGDHDHDGDHDHGEEGHSHPEGDHDHGEGETHEDADEGAPEDEDSASTKTPELIRFVADKSIKVPNMMCPYSCWPNVKKTLAAQPGVEAVQLAAQPDGTPEGEIAERVVELKLNGDFDADAAIAALGKIDFDAEAVN